MMEDIKLAVKEMRSAIRSEVLDFKKRTRTISGYLSIDTSLYAIFALYARHIGNIEEHNDTFVTDRPLSNSENKIWQYFLPSVKNLKEQGVYNAFVCLVNNLFKYNAECYENAYSFIIDDLIDFLFNLNKTNEGCNATPDCLSRFFARYTEVNRCTTFYNPFAGLANFIKYIHPHCSYYGQEINEFYVALAQLRMDAYHMTSAEIDCANSIQEWKNDESDCIVADMLWNAPYIRLSDRVTPIFFFFTKVILSSARISFGIYPCNILWNSNSDYKTARKQAIELDLVDTVIQLPSGLFENTSASACVIITNRQKAHPGYVRFVDASSLAKKITQFRNTIDAAALMELVSESTDERIAILVPNNKVSSQDYALQPSNYLKIDAPDNANLVKLSDVIGRKQIGTIKSVDPDTFIRVVHISNLTANAQMQDIDFLQLKPELCQHRCRYINEDALLISRIAKLKPTFYKNIRGGIYVHPNIFAFRIDSSKVLPDYLVQELNKEYVLKQIGVVGAYQSFSLDALLDVQINIPTLEEQRISLLKVAESQIAKAKQDHANLSAQKEQEMIGILNMRQHSMNGLMEKFKNSLHRLQKKIEQVEGNEDLVTTMHEIIERLQHQYALLYDEINDFAKPTFGEAEVVDLVAFLNTLVPLQENYVLTGFGDNSQFSGIKHAYTKICAHDLQRMVSDIMRNAEKHGFVDDQRKDYIIDIKLEDDVDTNRWIIDFCNNGKPLPEGIDKLVYGIPGGKTGEHAGKGQGGATVRWTTQHFGGDYDIFREERFGEMYTIIRVILPKYDTDE